MSDSNQVQTEWNEMLEQMNEAMADSIEQNMEAQAEFAESWADAFEETLPEEDAIEEGIAGYNRAYEVWMDAADQMVERTADVAQGEDVSPSEFRDLWLQSANEAFKEVMSTSAFAAANGQLVEALLESQQQFDEMNQDAIASLGLPTREDIDEVGERLVELERRQHAVEEKLDRVLDALEE
ncbi:MAG: poly(R)-hydroxyalkanoic acid synthase subunit PhaE [Haloarculaceae archaeon]